MYKERGVNWEGGHKSDYVKIDGPVREAVWDMVPVGTQIVEVLQEDGENYLVGHMKGLEIG